MKGNSTMLFGRIMLICLLGLQASCGLAQGLNNLWLGGYDSADGIPWGGSTIDFSSGSPSIYYQFRYMDFGKTNCNITDSSGNLLFATNGQYVMDAAGDTMVNGAGLNPSLYTSTLWPTLSIYQANFIIPKPGSSTKYYLFHNTIDSIYLLYSDNLYLTEIDMSLNGGLGEVVQKNTILYNQQYNIGKIQGVKHGNGRDWWIYVHGIDNNDFIRFLVSPYDIDGPYVQTIGTVRPADQGQISFSPDGSKLAYYWGETDLDIFDVDRCSGLLSNHLHVPISDNDASGGVAFSPSSRFLYVTSVLDAYQYDLDAVDIAASMVHIAEWDSTYSPSPPFATFFEYAQLAPDGKIYVSTGNGTDKLHVINYPDSAGLACDFAQHAITLPTYWLNSLPNHPNFFLGAAQGSICDSLSLVTNTSYSDGAEMNLLAFPNPNSGSFRLSFSPQPVAGVLELYDVNGKLLFDSSIAPWSQSKEVESSNLLPGLYHCSVRFNQQVSTIRIVVQ